MTQRFGDSASTHHALAARVFAMSQSSLPPEMNPNTMDAETAARVERLIESEEGVMNRFTGALGVVAVGLALAMSLFHLYAAWSIVPTTTLRFAHVGFTMVLGFFLFPVARNFRDRFLPWDWALIAAAIYVPWYLISGGADLRD
eukprot:gene52477-64137_t